MFLTSLKMISMIYMPGLHTCLLLERWIAGSPDRRIAPLCSLCSRPHNYFTFLVYLNYTRTPHKVKHFLIIFENSLQNDEFQHQPWIFKFESPSLNFSEFPIDKSPPQV